MKAWACISSFFLPLGVRALNRPLSERCRLCRFMTVLYYLEDTKEGGEWRGVVEKS